jgi:hypothetical protein
MLRITRKYHVAVMEDRHFYISHKGYIFLKKVILNIQELYTIDICREQL